MTTTTRPEFETIAPGVARPADPKAASSLYNKDLAPTTASERNWSVWSVAALWVSMCACIPTYLQASGLYDSGMNWWQTVATIFLANLIVLIPMVLNAHAGTKYGIPFPVYARASFGVRGANVPAMLRALVGCGWFGIQCWIGGMALFAIACIFKPEWADNARWPAYLGITAPQFGAFMAFWLMNILVIFAGINSIRWLLNIKAPLLIVLGLGLLGWAYHRAGGFGPLFRDPPSAPADGSLSRFWTLFAPSLTANVGFWATVSLNIPDFSRYAKSQRDQVLGQSVALPTTMALFAFIAVTVSSATFTIFGKPLWDPVDILKTFDNPWALGLSMGAVVLATLATNIAANVVSPANDFANLAPRYIGFRTGGLITGLIGIASLPWKLLSDPNGYIFTWQIGYSALLGAVGGVLVCDYWLLRRTRLSTVDLFRRDGRYAYDRGVNWSALLACAIAISPCVPGFIDKVTAGHVLSADHRVAVVLRHLYDYSVFVTFAVASLLYALFMAGHANVRQPVELTMNEFVGDADALVSSPVTTSPTRPAVAGNAEAASATDDTYVIEPDADRIHR